MRGGRSLWAVWSRSAKHVIISVGGASPLGQTMLELEQVASLAEILEDPASSASLDVIDDEANELEAEWDPRGRWIALAATPVRDLGGIVSGEDLARYRDDPTRIQLKPDQAAELARFLRERPPS